jgi:hypothetical protein
MRPRPGNATNCSDALKYIVDNSERRFGIVLSDMQAELFEVGARFDSPADLHDGSLWPLQKLVDASLDFFMADQFAPVCLPALRVLC